MGAFIQFNRGVLKSPVGVQLWLIVLMAFNLLVPLFYLSTREAQIVIITFLLSAMLMVVLTGVSGFSRLLGLGHILWLPLIIFLITRLNQIPANDFFGFWIRALIVLNALSLILDTIDVVRYVAGDREETV